MEKFRLPRGDFDTMVLIEGELIYTRSSAALRIVKRLPFPWPILYIFVVVPKFIRDLFYRILARNRYRWFGKKAECLIPTPEIRSRFLG